MVNSFRSRMRQLADNLMQSTRRLLGAKSEDEQKKLVESVLENALLLQTSLQESGALDNDSAHAGDESLIRLDDPRLLDLASNGDLQT